MYFLVLFCFFFKCYGDHGVLHFSLHDALPILSGLATLVCERPEPSRRENWVESAPTESIRKRSESTRLNSSHQIISYAVFCLKKKKKTKELSTTRRTSERKNIQEMAHNVEACH